MQYAAYLDKLGVIILLPKASNRRKCRCPNN